MVVDISREDIVAERRKFTRLRRLKKVKGKKKIYSNDKDFIFKILGKIKSY